MTIPAMAPPERLSPWLSSVGAGVELLVVDVCAAVDMSSARQLICILWACGELFIHIYHNKLLLRPFSGVTYKGAKASKEVRIEVDVVELSVIVVVYGSTAEND